MSSDYLDAETDLRLDPESAMPGPDREDHRTQLSAMRGRPQIVSMNWKHAVLRVTPTGPGIGEREAFIIARNVHDAFKQYGSRMRTFVLDLRHIRSVSSLGLGVCVDLRHAAKAAGAKSIVYFGGDSQLRELFRMMRVDRLFTVARDEKALDRLAR